MTRTWSTQPFGGQLSVGGDTLFDPGSSGGVSVGQVQVGDTGVTLLLCDQPTTAAVDVRGGGPGTRETDLLDPWNTMDKVHAIALCGGSAFGLAAADGVMRSLSDAHLGIQVSDLRPEIRVPLVPAAVIFDLLVGEPDLPDSGTGRAAYDAAVAAREAGVQAEPLASGSVGAGTAAMAGAIKGGVGRASVKLPESAGGYEVSVIVVANPAGAVVGPDGRLYGDPDAGTIQPEAREKLDRFFVGMMKFPVVTETSGSKKSLNTTIGAALTDAPLTASQAKRLAMSAHDGLAIAVRPAHLPMDGDTFFALATGEDGTVTDPELAILSAATADATRFAIVDAVSSATEVGGVPAWRDISETDG